MAAGRWWRLSIALTLGALICIPTAGLLGVSTATAVARQHDAEQAAHVRHAAERVTRVTQLRFAVQRESFASAVVAAGTSWGIDSDTIGAALGFDPEERIAEARAEVDALVAELGPVADISLVAVGVTELRRLVDASRIGFESVLSRYGSVERLAADVVDEATAELRAERSELADTTGVDEALRVLDDALAVHQRTLSQLGALARVLLPMVGGQGDALAEMIGEVALLAEAARGLDDVASGPVRRTWREIRDDESMVAFEQAIRDAWAAALETDRGPVLDTAATLALAPTFADGVRSAALTLDLVGVASNDLGGRAEQLESEARSAFRRDLLTVAVLVVVTALAGLFTARGIARPLRRLARLATAVSDGALDVPPLTERGPTEVAVVTRAFNEMVANLRAVESQASALAAGKLDDPALEMRLKGSLALAVQDSVTRLSRSLSERDELERRLAHEATHDALTGLANRALFNDRIEHALARHARGGEDVAIVYCDLDGFKTINDSLGHDAGDRLLCIAAGRLASAIRHGDTLARLGGDEFAVLLEGPPGLLDEAVLVGDRILSTLSDPVEINGVPMVVTASVGVAAASQGIRGADDLLRDADAAMFEAKRGVGTGSSCSRRA